MIFKYKISTKDGKIKKGEIEWSDKLELINKFRNEGYLIISLKEKKKGGLASFSLEKVGELEKIYLIKNLSLMIKAGLPLPEIMLTLIDQAKTQKLKIILKEIKIKTEQGMSLSEAFSKYPHVFSPIFLGLIKLGEETGQLEETTEHLHGLFLSQYDFKKKVKSALIYPAAVIITSLVVFISIFLFLFPRLTRLFSSLQIQPPLITRIFISLMNFFQKNSLFLFLAVILFIIIYLILSRKEKIRKFFQKFDLSLPIIGRILQHINLSYFAKNLGLLLKSGMPIEKALMLNLEITENEVYKKIAEEILEGVRKGETLAFNLSKHQKEFPKNFTKIVESGEKSGNLIESLSYLSSFYEFEIERETKDLTIALEPILLLFVGLVVAFIAVAIISPIYQYISSIQVMK